jgi:hypothetical protein
MKLWAKRLWRNCLPISQPRLIRRPSFRPQIEILETRELPKLLPAGCVGALLALPPVRKDREI